MDIYIYICIFVRDCLGTGSSPVTFTSALHRSTSLLIWDSVVSRLSCYVICVVTFYGEFVEVRFGFISTDPKTRHVMVDLSGRAGAFF